MNIVIKIVVVVLQFILGYILGPILAMFTGAGDGWELVVFGIGSAVGVWAVGAIAAKVRQRDAPLPWMALVGALIGGGLGAGVILLTPATGFSQILYPLVGALIGYYAANAVQKS